MLKRSYLIFVFLAFAFFLSLPFVFSAPPFQSSQGISGCLIEYPKIDIIQINKNFEFDFHVINYSNGIVLTNKNIACSLHIYNKYGEHKYTNDTPAFTEDYDFVILVDKGNFTEIEVLSYIFQCNNSAIGCFVSAPMEVTAEGEPTTSLLNLNIFFYVLVFIIIILGFWIKNEYVTLIGSITLTVISVLMYNDGIGIYNNEITRIVTSIFAMIGGFISIKIALDIINENFG